MNVSVIEGERDETQGAGTDLFPTLAGSISRGTHKAQAVQTFT